MYDQGGVAEMQQIAQPLDLPPGRGGAALGSTHLHSVSEITKQSLHIDSIARKV